MSAAAWRLEKHLARLKLDQLDAVLDPKCPAQGMVEVYSHGRCLDAAHLLTVDASLFSAGNESSLIECYTRGNDLVSAYEDSSDRPTRIDLLWRAVTPTSAERFVAAVELSVSVRTELLDGRPDLTVQSELAAAETLRLVDADVARYRAEEVLAAAPTLIRPSDGPGCLLFRPPAMEVSYAEMVHPADFQEDELARGKRSSGAGATMQIRHNLFAGKLEKGVILCARVRGVLVPRADDTHIVAACYKSLRGPP